MPGMLCAYYVSKVQQVAKGYRIQITNHQEVLVEKDDDRELCEQRNTSLALELHSLITKEEVRRRTNQHVGLQVVPRVASISVQADLVHVSSEAILMNHQHLVCNDRRMQRQDLLR
jgi:hypothetical protein